MSTIASFALIRAAMAHRKHDDRMGGQLRRLVADLVRRVHGGGAGGDGAADDVLDLATTAFVCATASRGRRVRDGRS
jgi:hypothetical protein